MLIQVLFGIFKGEVMDKQLSLVYFSATDGTKKVVRGIADGISDSYKEYDITMPSNRQESLIFDDNEIVIIGVPVYAGRVPLFLMDYLSKLKGNNTPTIFITVYGNRNYDDALLELKEMLEKNGFVGVAAGAFIGEHSNSSKVGTSRPDEKDLEVARKFGYEIKNKLDNLLDTSQLSKLTVKGNYPYKDITPAPPMAPDTNDQCINCGICAKNCPVSAINFDNYSDVTSTKCIRCSSCIKRCPVNAKAINHEVFNKITNLLIENFSAVRNEPEYFI